MLKAILLLSFLALSLSVSAQVSPLIHEAEKLDAELDRFFSLKGERNDLIPQMLQQQRSTLRKLEPYFQDTFLLCAWGLMDRWGKVRLLVDPTSGNILAFAYFPDRPIDEKDFELGRRYFYGIKKLENLNQPLHLFRDDNGKNWFSLTQAQIQPRFGGTISLRVLLSSSPYSAQTIQLELDRRSRRWFVKLNSKEISQINIEYSANIFQGMTRINKAYPFFFSEDRLSLLQEMERQPLSCLSRKAGL